MTHAKCAGNRCSLLLIALSCLIGTLATSVSVSAQGTCLEQVARLQELYDNGRFGEVVALLEQCPPDSLPEAEGIKAYRILALSFIAEDLLDSARTAVRKMLDLNEDIIFEEDNEKFAAMVTEEKAKRQRKKKFIYIAGGVTLAGLATTFIIFRGDDGLQRLPGPPAFPSR